MFYLFQILFLIYNHNNYYFLIEYNSILLILLVLYIFSLLKLLNNSKLLTLHKWFLVILFLFKNIFIFYVFYELSILPLILFLIKYNYKYNRIISIKSLLIYSLLGSFLFILALILIYNNIGTFSYYIYKIYLNNYYIELLLILALIIKVPILPLHNWLPLVHSESNTIGSIILASILLKVGLYGLIIYINNLNNHIQLLSILSILSILYSFYHIFKLFDLKKIIAFSSIIHMNYTIFILFYNNNYTLNSVYYSIISHGIISSMLFLTIGIIYKQLFTRNYLFIKGISNLVPYLSSFILISFLSNNSLPFTSSFITELLTFLGLFESNIFILIFILITIFISTLYTFNYLNKILFGPIKKPISELNLNELFILIIFNFYNILLSINTYYITILWF